MATINAHGKLILTFIFNDNDEIDKMIDILNVAKKDNRFPFIWAQEREFKVDKP